MAPILRDISIFSGNTILGDGSVIMILDPNGIAAASGEVTPTDHAMREAEGQHEQPGAERMALLIFRAGGAAPKAVPLSLIARLEEVKLESIEYSQGRPMVQYRGHLMPLVTVSDDYKLKEDGRQPVLVFSDHSKTMGLVVDEIIEIIVDLLRCFPFETLGDAIRAEYRDFCGDLGDVPGIAEFFQRQIAHELQSFHGAAARNDGRAGFVEVLLGALEGGKIQIPMLVVKRNILGNIESRDALGKTFLETVAAKFAVGNRLHPGVFLQPNRLADASFQHRAVASVIDFAARMRADRARGFWATSLAHGRTARLVFTRKLG